MALGWGLEFVWIACKSISGSRGSRGVAVVADRVESGGQKEGEFGIGVGIGVCVGCPREHVGVERVRGG